MSEKEREYVNDVLDRQFDTTKNSKYNTALEAAFAERFKMPFGIGMVNGTCTMHTALVCEGIGAGDEVICPALTMSATSLCILQAGAIPVYADIERETFQICAKSIAEKITPKTKAIITVALYGLCPDYDPIVELCKEHNLILIEDNAENYLGTYKGRLVGEIGEYSSYSFQASKHMTCGEGGMLLIKDAEKADFARRFSCLGYGSVSGKKQKITRADLQDPLYNRHVCMGFNFRMSELQAACALGQLERINELVAIRVQVGAMFRAAVADYPFLKPIKDCGEERTNSYWGFPMVLDCEDENDWYKFRDIWREEGGDFFYAAWKLSYMEDYWQLEVQNYPGVTQKYAEGLLPHSEWVQKRLIALKTNYWDLKEAEGQAALLTKCAQIYKEKYLS